MMELKRTHSRSRIELMLTLVLTVFTSSLSAQIDTEFWFGAPDLTMGADNEPRRDSTVFIVVASFDQPSQVRVSLPANLSFDPIIINLAPNSLQQINLGPFLSLIETKPADTVVNTGILVQATKPITAYYEVRSPNNTDIFSLKGKNAVGTRFYTPFQTVYQNNQFLAAGNFYAPPPRSGFIVMATKNATSVTITPSIDILNHPAGVPYTVFLNRGQTYYGEALDGAPASHPGGTLIESDKEITVTVKDDMIDVEPSNPGGADVIGDQLIASEFLGKDHIFVKGEVNLDSDRIVIVGTVDGTNLFIDGSTTPISIDEGEQYIYPFTSPSSYLSASENVVAFQVTGLTDQIAGAAVPSLNCTGSNQVGFVRGGPRPFFLTVTIRAGEEDNFELNGDPDLLPASAFQPVVGTNGEYVFARVEYSINQIPIGQPNFLTNFGSELFHVATSNGNSASVNFGYFSAFSFLNIGSSTDVCLNDSLTLDAGPGKTSYLWSTGDTTQSITIFEAGLYTVQVQSGSDCAATDTIEVNYYEPPIDLGPNDTICEGTALNLEVDGVYLFEWQDGTTANNYQVTEPGLYYVTVTDFQDCQFRDSIEVAVSPRPQTPEISGNLTYCQGEAITLSMDSFPNATYFYVLPDSSVVSGQSLTIPSAQPGDSGLYLGYYVVDGCETFNDSVQVLVNPFPQLDLGENIEVCQGTVVILDPGIEEGSFEWQDDSTAPTYTVTESGTYTLTYTAANNCSSTDSVSVVFNPLPADPEIQGALAYCVGDTLQLSIASQPDATYLWTAPDGSALPNDSVITVAPLQLQQAGLYTAQVQLGSCFSAIDSATVVVSGAPDLQLAADTTVCTGDTATVTAPPGFASYQWSTGSTDVTTALPAGTFTLTVSNAAGCLATDTLTITAGGPQAAFTLLPDSIVTPGTTIAFTDASQEGFSPIDSWFWDFGTGASSTLQNPSFTYADGGVYPVILQVTDQAGCSDQASIHIISRFDFRIPEGFSPNADGINDFFVITGLEGLSGTQVQVFNRWGAVVFESTNYGPGRFWDGENHTDGTYFYIVKLPNGETLNGPVTIAR